MKKMIKEATPLMEALMALSPNSSKTTLKSWVRDGRVSIDGNPVSSMDIILTPGQTLSLNARAKFVSGGIRILFEDKHLVIIDKPTGVLSVSTVFQKEETAHAFLKSKYRPKKVYVVHRLDQDTSGVMVFALSEEGYTGLKKIFKDHDIDRVYYALVEGTMKSKSGTWKCYLYEDSNYVVHPTKDSSLGELAITHYKVLTSVKHYTLLELKLETGKKNQIRVHCQLAGNPVAGDKKYGAQTDPLKRLGLHAGLLAFIHPVTGKRHSIQSPLPTVFYKVIPHENA